MRDAELRESRYQGTDTGPLLQVVTVTYESPAKIARHLSSLQSQSNSRWRCLVVDNSPSNSISDVVAPVSGDDARIEYLRTGANLGYLPAVQHALQRFQLLTPRTFLGISNPDIVFDPDFVSALADDIQLHGFADVLAPSIEDSSTGAPRNPYLLRPNSWPKRAYMAAASSSRRLRRAAKSMNKTTSQSLSKRRRSIQDSEEEILTMYAPHGSLMLLPPEFFARGGHLRYPIPLFGEEEFVGDVAKSVGLPVRWCPHLKVTHETSHAGNSASAFIQESLRRATWRGLLPARLRIRPGQPAS